MPIINFRSIIDGLSEAISEQLARKCSEESEPAYSSDMSDERISTAGKKIANLRRIRAEVEEIAAGYTGDK